ncbi:hypothetical protein C5167_044838 [Papaver somniferum]|uniref:uncharacterized protein LOC113335624 n=1 Tax=Papaver somniferum TaxID=3469 RepID=UPI000E6FA799|nr:uncharacterized protein LOC113335624 [Papaver somniferum]XP_026437436.1 uncharacterized protein LOC113335624 [Papaver somniferum]XP_026437437.1 uncharacterized protein LOC113335624 [Papaver somniferum]XP_026437438.1 uncharacterized protein LOC113335624 [Papaver somniferum]RZC90209.1 hypothetical protein C5167_044838 [Papaver somniferum]
MATKTKNVAVMYLMCILVFVVAFQVCKADSVGEIYRQCMKECDDKCKADGYGDIFCHGKCSVPCDAKQRQDNINQKFTAVKDTATFIRRSISKATTSSIKSTDACLVAFLGTFMLALYH